MVNAEGQVWSAPWPASRTLDSPGAASAALTLDPAVGKAHPTARPLYAIAWTEPRDALPSVPIVAGAEGTVFIGDKDVWTSTPAATDRPVYALAVQP